MVPKLFDASAPGGPLMPLFRRATNRATRAAGPGADPGASPRQPTPPDYSSWTLRPEMQADLGDSAPFMEQMLRLIGPSMLGRQSKMFYRFMAPPDQPPPAPQPENVFATMLPEAFSGRAGPGRNAMLSLLGNMLPSRRR